MFKIVSKLEDNMFLDVLVKKGSNLFYESDFKKLKSDKNFISFQNKKFIIIEQKKSKVSVSKAPIDFESMNWKDLLAYAKSKGISVKAKSKIDIINELKEQKGE